MRVIRYKCIYMQVYNYVLDRCTLGISDVDKMQMGRFFGGGGGGGIPLVLCRKILEYCKVALIQIMQVKHRLQIFYRIIHVHYSA